MTRYEPHHLDAVSEQLCMAAVDEIGLEMGGVDLLYDKSGAPYLLEVNFPVVFNPFKGVVLSSPEPWLPTW